MATYFRLFIKYCQKVGKCMKTSDEIDVSPSSLELVIIEIGYLGAKSIN
jgi:hypothetical protein